MLELQKQFHDFIRRHNLLIEEDFVLLAVSGGVDSVVMLDLFAKSEFKFGVAHCNFGLRGKESDGDEELVRGLAEKLQVPYHCKHIQIEGSVQLEARNERYKWFNELKSSNGYTKIATAHHLNDSLETFLINLGRGTGIKGISGIAASSASVIRPLLCTSKKGVLDYASARNLIWREDATNAKSDYDRNFIRNEIVPKFDTLNPSMIKTFEATWERLQDANALVQKKVKEVSRAYTYQEGTATKLDLIWLKSREDVLILSEILAGYGFNYATVKEIVAALGSSGKTFSSDGWNAYMDREALYLKEKDSGSNIEFTVEQEGEYEIGEQVLTVKQVSAEEFNSDRTKAFLDLESVKFPLTVRNWKEGDAFRPLGMNGLKKVSDFLIDTKVPVPLKEDILVVESEGEIMWLAGHRISNSHKVRNSSKRVLRLQLSNKEKGS